MPDDDPDAAAARLEVALERIASLASARPAAPVPDPPDDSLSVPEIAERLDQLIGRLRAALGNDLNTGSDLNTGEPGTE